MLGHPLRASATLLAVLLVFLALGPMAPASAVPSGQPVPVLTGPDTARIGRTTILRATVRDEAQQPVAAVGVQLQRQDAEGGWTTIADSVTTTEGVAELPVVPVAGPQQLRATTTGEGEPVAGAAITLEGVVVSSSMSISGSRSVVDEQSGHLSIRWVGSDGFPVQGRVTTYLRRAGQPWSRLGTTTTGSDGRASVQIRPRWDTYYQLHGASGRGWRSAVSATWKVDNRPPLTPVKLPWGAPRPRSLPAQYRALGSGTNVVTHLISDSVWKRMVGRSWHSGCPVGRSQLRYIRTNYWGFDGYRHRGELVVRATKVAKFKAALMKLYGARVRIRAMYLPDRFGRSAGAWGANDRASMSHDNTSAFNCRSVTGDPGNRSPHSYGGSIDINPWENPFHSHVGWLPNSWWAHKQVGSYAWKSRSHPVVKLMAAAGFRWTYGVTDSQHFDG